MFRRAGGGPAGDQVVHGLISRLVGSLPGLLELAGVVLIGWAAYQWAGALAAAVWGGLVCFAASWVIEYRREAARRRRTRPE